ncbi:MAG: hypothetical protein ACI8ZB_004406 [Desulforhopalus sp.]|jgi:hypothetical protein
MGRRDLNVAQPYRVDSANFYRKIAILGRLNQEGVIYSSVADKKR